MGAKLFFIDETRHCKEHNNPFNALLRKAHILRKSVPTKSDDLIWQEFGDLQRLFEALLNKSLLAEKNIGTDIFMCSSYVASLLAKTGSSIPKSWYAIDYILEGYENDDPFVLQDGADVCFLLYSLYPARCNRRSMKTEDYATMGENLYYGYYAKTGREIGYYMSNLFELMADTTAKCIANL